MAMETGSLFQNRSIDIDRLLVSPALRCLKTAKPISEAICEGLEMNIEEGLYDIPIMGLYSSAGLEPEVADGWDYPYIPWPTLAERKCYFTNINMEYQSKVKVEKVFQQENQQPVGVSDMEKEFAAYIKRTMDTSKSILEQFPEENLCVVSHGITIVLMAAAMMKIDFATAVGDMNIRKVGVDNKGLLGGIPKMASVTRIYRKKNGSSGDNDNEWKIDTSLVNSVDHLSPEYIDLTHGGLPKGTPMQLMKQFPLIPQLMKKGIDANDWEVVDRGS